MLFKGNGSTGFSAKINISGLCAQTRDFSSAVTRLLKWLVWILDTFWNWFNKIQILFSFTKHIANTWLIPGKLRYVPLYCLIFINFVSITILVNVQLVTQLAHKNEENSAITELLVCDVLCGLLFFFFYWIEWQGINFCWCVRIRIRNEIMFLYCLNFFTCIWIFQGTELQCFGHVGWSL